MKVGVIIFPGSNCDEDIINVLRTEYNQNVVTLWHKNHDLQACDFIVVPGGFSYGDYLRSGAIARYSPLMQEVAEYADKGGLVMGICNGFQILTESHLLPGALLRNEERLFNCSNQFIIAQNNNTVFTRNIPSGKALKIPIAHGEGRYFADDETMKKLNENGQVLFRYCDENGEINNAGNPNGSLQNIAGVCNANKNVFGMMPHPERASSSVLFNTDGKFIFDSILNLVAA